MDKRWSLVIEDDMELSSAFGEILELSGLGVKVARDGHSALAILADAVPDLVLLDLHLPGMSGIEILEYIRSDKRLMAIRVVIVSADVARLERIKEKVDLVLVKPVSFAEIFGLAERFFPNSPKF
jgi:CheY-like chemotaxis protein